MSTTKSRVNISVPDDVREALLYLAKRDQMPAATKAKNLLELGLEVEEDEAWDQIAAKRDTKAATFRSHAEVFGD